jgi:hypothetical protein
MELEIIVLSEISQSQRDKRYVFSHMWNLDSLKKKKRTWKWKEAYWRSGRGQGKEGKARNKRG